MARGGRLFAQPRQGGRHHLALRTGGVRQQQPTDQGRVAFPPGGCAFLHKHWGPGIRCLLDGGIRIDTHGRSTSYGPGTPWYETGSDPVFAQAAMDRPSRFIRVMVLPRELLGKSSFQFVNEADKAKPRVQQYKILADAPIATPK